MRSYRQLPALIYHIQTKWRDDPRPRAGLIRVREFTMLDSYSLDADSDGLSRQYDAHYQAYFRIFERCELPVVTVKSDTGMMGGKLAHEYMYLTDIGEDTLILCDACGYTANRQVAAFRKPAPSRRSAAAHREGRHAAHHHYRRPGRLPGRAGGADGESGFPDGGGSGWRRSASNSSCSP